MHPIRFKGAHSVLSNFHPNWIHAEDLGMWCYSVEQGYQQQCAMYNGYDDVADKIMAVPATQSTGKICKQLAKERIRMKRTSWSDVKEAILYDFLKLKLEQYPPFRHTLLATERPLHHTVASDYWGMGKDGSGRNRFGKLLMRLRKSVRSTWPTPNKNVRILAYIKLKLNLI